MIFARIANEISMCFYDFLHICIGLLMNVNSMIVARIANAFSVFSYGFQCFPMGSMCSYAFLCFPMFPMCRKGGAPPEDHVFYGFLCFSMTCVRTC